MKKVTPEEVAEIREKTKEYLHRPTQKEIKAMSDWGRAFYPSTKQLFELQSPQHVQTLLRYIDQLERKS
jgi:hypothetical protein